MSAKQSPTNGISDNQEEIILSGYKGQVSKFLMFGFLLVGLLVTVQLLTVEPVVAASENKQASKSDTGVAPAIAQKILSGLKQGRPELNYTGVNSTPMPGIYEVKVERGPLLYVSEDGKHFIAGGEMYGVEPGGFVNLHEQALKPKRVELMAQVKASDQIIFSPKGKPKAHISVFTDVDCGYCRKLHNEVPAMNAKGIEVRYMAYPRAGLRSASFDKIATAWCADDPQETLTRLKNRENVEIKVCDDNPIADQLALGVKVGVQGTPALILADGSLIPGYVGANELAKMLGLE